MPSVTSIVARSFPDYIIGKESKLPWHLRTDLKEFKQRTQGHAIIMGRKTFESLGKPLKKRINIVLSRSNVVESAEVKWAPNPETALLLADIYSIYLHKTEFFVIGGEQIYDLFYKFINKVWLTEVFCGRLNGDAKFDRQFSIPEWMIRTERDYPSGEHDDWPFRITKLLRRKPVHRSRSKDEFVKVDVDMIQHLEHWGSVELDWADEAETAEIPSIFDA